MQLSTQFNYRAAPTNFPVLNGFWSAAAQPGSPGDFNCGDQVSIVRGDPQVAPLPPRNNRYEANSQYGNLLESVVLVATHTVLISLLMNCGII